MIKTGLLVSAALGVVSSISGCCFTPPTASTVAPPVVIPPPPITAVPPPLPTNSMDTCLQLCEHFGHCLDTRGAPRTPETTDCAQACSVGHTYGSLPAQAYVCLNQPTCVIFESCLNAAIGAALAGMPPGGMPPGMPPGAGMPPTTEGAPPNWPEGFPVVPGGIPIEAPPAGPVRVALLMYSMTGADLDAAYHAALTASGWTATPSEAGPEARRFNATRAGATVSISILEFEGGATIQTMQF